MNKFSDIMKALGDKNRYHIVESLLQHNFCVGALAKKLGMSESAVSQHLKILRNVGIVQGERKGYYTHYSVNRDLLRAAAKELTALAELEKTSLECSKSHGSNHSCSRKELKQHG